METPQASLSGRVLDTPPGAQEVEDTFCPGPQSDVGMATVLKNKGHSVASYLDAKDKIQGTQVPGPVCLIPTP